MTTRLWAVGMSALCEHSPRCANIYEVEDGVDVTFPCSGLGLEDAAMIVAAFNAAVPECLTEAIEAEVSRIRALLATATRLGVVKP